MSTSKKLRFRTESPHAPDQSTVVAGAPLVAGSANQQDDQANTTGKPIRSDTFIQRFFRPLWGYQALHGEIWTRFHMPYFMCVTP